MEKINKLTKYIVSSMLIVGILLSSIYPLYATSITELEKEKAQIKANLTQAAQDLSTTQAEKSAALIEVDAIDVELTEVTDLYVALENELSTTRELLAQTEVELSDAEAEREAQYQSLKERLRFMYINSRGGYMEVLFSSESVGDFLNRAEYINQIAKYDQELVDDLIEVENLIDVKLTEITKHKNETEVLTSRAEVQKIVLENTLAQKNEILTMLGANEAQQMQFISDLQAEDVKIQALINSAEAEAARLAAAAAAAAAAAQSSSSSSSAISTYNTSSSYTGGKLAWPVPGRSYVSSAYGNRTSPISGKSEFHSGIDIPGTTGMNIVSAESGVVLQSGWNSGGYGYMVIVDHGGSLSTMYAHASKLSVSAGDYVSRGQTVALVGSTGYSTGPHLHFEVRLNGKTQNPMNYVQ